MSALSRCTSFDVETPPRDAVVAGAHDDDSTLLKRRAVRLGSRPVNLRKDGVALDRRPEDLCVEVGDAFEQRRPVGAHLGASVEGPGRKQRLLAEVVLVEAGEHPFQVVRVLRSGQPLHQGARVTHRSNIRWDTRPRQRERSCHGHGVERRPGTGHSGPEDQRDAAVGADTQCQVVCGQARDAVPVAYSAMAPGPPGMDARRCSWISPSAAASPMASMCLGTMG